MKLKLYFESIAKHYGVEIKNKKIKDLPRWFMEKILYGTGDEQIDFEYSSYAGTRKFTAPFEGVIPTLDRRHNETKSQGMRDFYEMYMTDLPCHDCNGARLKPEILSIKIVTFDLFLLKLNLISLLVFCLVLKFVNILLFY